MPRKVILITYKGKTQSAYAWAKELGIPVDTLYTRLKLQSKHNWTISQVLSTKPLSKRPNAQTVTYQGTTQTIYSWARKLGIDYSTLRSRIVNHNWPIERALLTPAPPNFGLTWVTTTAEDLPAGVQGGYEVVRDDLTIGVAYKLKTSKWTHSGVINLKFPQYSPVWSSRYEAALNLLEQLGEKTNN